MKTSLPAITTLTSPGMAPSPAALHEAKATPSTSAVPLDDGVDDLRHGWNMEDKLAIDEVEQFDDVVGFLDEAQTPKIRGEMIERSRRR